MKKQLIAVRLFVCMPRALVPAHYAAYINRKLRNVPFLIETMPNPQDPMSTIQGDCRIMQITGAIEPVFVPLLEDHPFIDRVLLEKEHLPHFPDTRKTKNRGAIQMLLDGLAYAAPKPLQVVKEKLTALYSSYLVRWG